MNCRLCLTETHNLLEIFGDEGQALNTAEIIKKHFWFEVLQNDNFSQSICNMCWKAIDSFHSFYCDIQQKQLDNHRTQKSDHPETKQDILNFISISKETDEEVLIKLEDGEEYTSPEIFCERILKEDLSSDDETLQQKFALVCTKDEPTTTEDGSREQSSKKIVKKTRKAAIKKPARTVKQKPAVLSEDEDCKPSRQKVRRGESAPEDEILNYTTLNCEECTANFIRFYDLKSHYRDVHNQKGHVVCCKKKLVRGSRVLEHIAFHLNPEAFQCGVCKKNFKDRLCLDNHMNIHVPGDQRPYKCTQATCDKSFMKNYQRRIHEQWHKNGGEKLFACTEPNCEKRYLNAYMLSAHVRVVHIGAYHQICEICAKVFNQRTGYLRHMAAAHAAVKEPRMECSLCGNWLSNRAALRAHMNRHRSEKDNHVCNICGKTAKNKTALNSHKRNIHVERTHKCHLCEKAFKRAINLKEHITTHTGETLYNCPYCPKTFNSNANMHSHKKRTHKAEWEAVQAAKKG